MSNYQKMVPVFRNDRRGCLTDISMQLEIDGTTWSVPRPLIEVDDNMVISPMPDVVDGNIQFRLDRWEILQVDPVVTLPGHAPTQAQAVTVARAFQADPAISFRHSPEALLAWVNNYIAAQQTARS